MTGRTPIRQAVAMLSSPHRAVIYRAYFLGHSTAQIAAEYRITESAVRAELHDAMKALQHSVSRTGPSGRSEFLAY